LKKLLVVRLEENFVHHHAECGFVLGSAGRLRSVGLRKIEGVDGKAWMRVRGLLRSRILLKRWSG